MTAQDISQKSSSTETPSNPNIVNPASLSVILLDEIAVGINKLLRLAEETTPKGKLTSMVFEISGTSTRREDINPPWCSMVIAVEGTVPVEFAVNDIGNGFCALLPNEQMPIDMKRALIKTLWFRGYEDAPAAIVRVYGVY